MRNGMLRVLGCLGLALFSCRIAPETRAPETADKELAAGVAAHEKGNFEAALSHAQRAVAVAPQRIEAHLLLARVADDMCVPNVQPQRDERSCKLAVEEYKGVLELDASQVDALKNLAYLVYQFNRVDESEALYRQGVARYPEDPDFLCGLAAINYSRVFHDVMEAKARLNIKPDVPMIQLPACIAIQDKHHARADEGIELVMRALQANNDSTLIRYLSELFRIRAQIQCRNRPAYEADRNAAKMWDLSWKQTWEKHTPADTLQKCPPAPPPPPDL